MNTYIAGHQSQSISKPAFDFLIIVNTKVSRCASYASSLTEKCKSALFLI